VGKEEKRWWGCDYLGGGRFANNLLSGVNKRKKMLLVSRGSRARRVKGAMVISGSGLFGKVVCGVFFGVTSID